MVPPRWLPAAALEFAADLRSTTRSLLHATGRTRGTAVLYDMDQSEGVYAAALMLRERFERVVIVTPRDTIAEETAMVTHQGINRRLSRESIRILHLHEPRWSASVEDGALELTQVYTGAVERIDDLVLLTYATPRAPDTVLLEPLRAAGVDVRLIGDCVAPRNLMAATAEGHAAGHAV